MLNLRDNAIPHHKTAPNVRTKFQVSPRAIEKKAEIFMDRRFKPRGIRWRCGAFHYLLKAKPQIYRQGAKRFEILYSAERQLASA